MKPTHTKVFVSLFGLHFAKSGKLPQKLGRYLNILKDDRESGDYDVYPESIVRPLLTPLRESEEFVAEAERYLGPLLTG